VWRYWAVAARFPGGRSSFFVAASSDTRDGDGSDNRARHTTLYHRQGINCERLAAVSRAIASVLGSGDDASANASGAERGRAFRRGVLRADKIDRSLADRVVTDPQALELLDQMADAHVMWLCALMAVAESGGATAEFKRGCSGDGDTCSSALSINVTTALYHALGIYAWLYGPLSRQVLVRQKAPHAYTNNTRARA
jgi:hypothetical protein